MIRLFRSVYLWLKSSYEGLKHSGTVSDFMVRARKCDDCGDGMRYVDLCEEHRKEWHEDISPRSKR